MDIFVEQIVKRQKGTMDYVKIVGICVGIVLLPVIVIIILGIFNMATEGLVYSPFFLGLSVWGGVYVLRDLNLEFEYSVTNGEITVDKIIAQRKRKRMLSIDVSNFESMGVYKPEAFAGRSFDTKLLCHDGVINENTWYATFRHKSLGHTLLVFSPEERVLRAMKPYLKRQVATDAFTR